MTLDGETEAASFACCVESAACTAGGRGVPGGSARPSAQRTRIVKRPVRDVGFPSGLAGVGVVERGGSSVPAESVAVEAFLVIFPSPLSIAWMRVKGGQQAGGERRSSRGPVAGRSQNVEAAVCISLHVICTDPNPMTKQQWGCLIYETDITAISAI